MWRDVSMKNRVNQIKDQQHKLNKELEQLQISCKHSDRTIKWDNVSKSYRWTCDVCQLIMNYPTIIELDKYLK